MKKAILSLVVFIVLSFSSVVQAGVYYLSAFGKKIDAKYVNVIIKGNDGKYILKDTNGNYHILSSNVLYFEN